MRFSVVIPTLARPAPLQETPESVFVLAETYHDDSIWLDVKIALRTAVAVFRSSRHVEQPKLRQCSKHSS
jgi:hypothetical protein